MLDSRVSGTLRMTKASKVIKEQVIFTRMVLIIEKMLLPHSGDFCFVGFVKFYIA